MERYRYASTNVDYRVFMIVVEVDNFFINFSFNLYGRYFFGVVITHFSNDSHVNGFHNFANENWQDQNLWCQHTLVIVYDEHFDQMSRLSP